MMMMFVLQWPVLHPSVHDGACGRSPEVVPLPRSLGQYHFALL